MKSLQVHEYLRSKLCSLYENDCIFDKFECCWNGNDRYSVQHFLENVWNVVVLLYVFILMIYKL